MAAENYHLKWDSHLSFLNSSIATLYKNEKFADVVLYSSNTNVSNSGNTTENGGMPTVGISAHKFILSSCSQFFATMFEAAPISAPNGILYVVLPPDLSYRAIQILVQYMYSGEATVSNDILSEVLRGGEILKIRGLCRSHHHHQRDSTSNASTHYGTNGTRPLGGAVSHSQLSGGIGADMYAITKCLPAGSSSVNRYSMDHTQHHLQFRGLGASVMPKDSPVIVKSPKLTQIGMLPNMPSSTKHHTGGITVNKEVAIDPEDKCCFQVNQQQHEPPLPPGPMLGGASLCREVGCNNCPLPPDVQQLPQRQTDEVTPLAQLSADRIEREYTDQTSEERCDRNEIGLAFDRQLSRRSRGERASEYFTSENYEHSTNNTKQFADIVGSRIPSSPPPPAPQNFLTIKQEPTDWSTLSSTESNTDTLICLNSPMQSPKQPLDFKIPLSGAGVKLEVATSHSADEEEQVLQTNDYDFTRFVCEICKKTFDDPKIWLRHLETHAQVDTVATTTPTVANSATASNGDSHTKSYVPKKRRRISQQENSMDHVTLLCDLCSTSFKTPAEWVRHMNNQHTEIELAMFNSKKDNEQKTSTNAAAGVCSTPSSSHQQTQKKYTNRLSLSTYSADHADRICDICNKKFTSNSSMLVHKRSHTSNNTNPLTAAVAPVSIRSTQSEQHNSMSSRA